jgi:hypothetical protein
LHHALDSVGKKTGFQTPSSPSNSRNKTKAETKLDINTKNRESSVPCFSPSSSAAPQKRRVIIIISKITNLCHLSCTILHSIAKHLHHHHLPYYNYLRKQRKNSAHTKQNKAKHHAELPSHK